MDSSDHEGQTSFTTSSNSKNSACLENSIEQNKEPKSNETNNTFILTDDHVLNHLSKNGKRKASTSKDSEDSATLLEQLKENANPNQMELENDDTINSLSERPKRKGKKRQVSLSKDNQKSAASTEQLNVIKKPNRNRKQDDSKLKSFSEASKKERKTRRGSQKPSKSKENVQSKTSKYKKSNRKRKESTLEVGNLNLPSEGCNNSFSSPDSSTKSSSIVDTNVEPNFKNINKPYRFFDRYLLEEDVDSYDEKLTSSSDGSLIDFMSITESSSDGA